MSNVEGTKKEFWIAFVLNFLLAGAGHVYAGATQAGVWLMVGNILSWALVAVMPVALVGVLGTWIYALIKSPEVVARYNGALLAQASAEQQQLADLMTPDVLVKQIGKVHQLLSAGMIDEAEFASRKLAIVQQVSLRKLAGSLDDFLLAAAPLKQSGVLTADDVGALKCVLSAGVRE